MPEPKKPVDYLQVAKNNLTIPNGITPEQYSIRVATAQAAATVALVEAQETANLIAWLALTDGKVLPEQVPGNIWDNVSRQVEERLGLA